MAAGHALVIWVALGGGSRRGPRKRLRCNEGYAVTRANTTGDNRRYVPCFLPLHRGAEGGSFSHGTRAHVCIELGPVAHAVWALPSRLPAQRFRAPLGSLTLELLVTRQNDYMYTSNMTQAWPTPRNRTPSSRGSTHPAACVRGGSRFSRDLITQSQELGEGLLRSSIDEAKAF